MDIFNYMKDSIPNDTSEQYSSKKMLNYLRDINYLPESILDLGCGKADSCSFINSLFPFSTWTGLDIESSPEVDLRTCKNLNFVSYDGTFFPFKNNSFDIIYTHQALEHIENPLISIKECYRTLKPGGFLCGQTSQLEPYHSFSTFNFTIYGFKKLVTDTGFTLSQIRPGIDAITLIERSINKRNKAYSKYFDTESPLNQKIEGDSKGKSKQIINHRKLMYCGQFVFLCKK